MLEAPWFAPLRPWLAATDPRDRGILDLERLNAFARQRALHTGSGRALHFVDARETPGAGYETGIHATGRVPTRTRGAGMLHDWFNALAWLAFPRTKAQLNAVHARALAAPGAGPHRGPARDTATLFDESGAAFVFADERLRSAFVARDWPSLFVEQREAFARGARVVVLGHALYEKLLDPYKAVCAHACTIAALPGDGLPGLADAAHDAAHEWVDARVAERLRDGSPQRTMLHPLPLLGVPGWWPDNADPSFYDDALVFRRTRRASRPRAG